MSKNKKIREEEVIVLLPAFNEEKTILQTIKSIRNILPNCEILVIDNNSTDYTFNISQKAKVQITKEPRQGKGFAVQKGFDYAIKRNFKVIILLDADDTYETKNLPSAINDIINNGYDLIVGTRIPSDKSQFKLETRQGQYRFGHKTGNKIFMRISKLLLPTDIEDVLSGWRVMNSRFVASFPGGSQGFEIEALLNFHAYTIKAAVKNYDVQYYGRPVGSNSKLNTYKDGWRILRTNLKNFKNDRPFLAFSLLATPWAIFTLFLIYLPIKTYLENGLVPNFPRLIAGMSTFLISALLWTSGIILERIRQVRENVISRNYHNDLDF